MSRSYNVGMETMSELVVYLDQKFNIIDDSFAAVDKKFNSLNERMDSFERRKDLTDDYNDSRFDHIERRFDSLDSRVSTIYDGVDALSRLAENTYQELRLLNKQVLRHDIWIHQLADHSSFILER